MSKVLRVRGRALQTPVLRYRHRQSGRVVTLVGTMHMGEKAYYERLQALVALLEAAGAAVHYEGIMPAAEGDWAAASDDERAVRAGLWADLDRGALMARYLGWVPQPIPLGRSPAWRNVDLTDLELARRTGPGTVREGQRVTGDGADEELKLMLIAGMPILTRVVALDRLGLLQRWAERTSGGEVLAQSRERDKVALAALPATGDVVLIWGAAHLPGLASGLRTAGYRRESRRWETVGTMPAWRTSARALWRWLRSR